jgi:hypothetical protein
MLSVGPHPDRAVIRSGIQRTIDRDSKCIHTMTWVTLKINQTAAIGA